MTEQQKLKTALAMRFIGVALLILSSVIGGEQIEDLRRGQ